MNEIPKKSDAPVTKDGLGAGELKAPIEASWAPHDPCDRVFDADARRVEKSVSAARLIASFHPVFNVFILFIDSFRLLGSKRAGLLWMAMIGLATSFGFIFNLSLFVAPLSYDVVLR